VQKNKVFFKGGLDEIEGETNTICSAAIFSTNTTIIMQNLVL
jgi:hypothetical protein